MTINLSTILSQYQEGERGLPAYDELRQLEAQLHSVHVAGSQPERAVASQSNGAVAWIERRFVDDELVHESVKLQPMPESQRAALEKHYRLEIVPLVPARRPAHEAESLLPPEGVSAAPHEPTEPA